jgi:hypothetical protein
MFLPLQMRAMLLGRPTSQRRVYLNLLWQSGLRDVLGPCAGDSLILQHCLSPVSQASLQRDRENCQVCCSAIYFPPEQ